MRAQQTLRAIPVCLFVLGMHPTRATGPAADVFVDAARGRDDAPGTADRPLKSISAAVCRLPDPLTASTTITVRAERLSGTGAAGMPDNRLDLAHRMRPGVVVRIVGGTGAGASRPVLGWEGGECMVDVREGDWSLEGFEIGSGSTRQRRGVMVTGPASITLKDVLFRVRSQSDAAIHARRGTTIALPDRTVVAK